MKFYWLKVSLAASLATSTLIGVWSYFIGGDVISSMLGGFIGMWFALAVIEIVIKIDKVIYESRTKERS